MPSAYVIALVLHFPFFYVIPFPELNILTLGKFCMYIPFSMQRNVKRFKF